MVWDVEEYLLLVIWLVCVRSSGVMIGDTRVCRMFVEVVQCISFSFDEKWSNVGM